jgi:lon-related putative ATP-dependent protease
MAEELPVEKLRRICDPQALDCETTEEVEPLETIIGQERAVRALEFGLGIKELGFNIYVAGPPGTGKTTAVQRFLEEVARGKAVPPDWCYVNDFRDPYRPNALRLPPGRGREFQKDVKNLVNGARRELPTVFESDEYAAQKEETVQGFQKQKQELLSQMGEKAKKEGFLLQMSPMGLLIVPVREGQPLSEEGFKALSPEVREELLQKRGGLQEELKKAMRQVRGLDKKANEALQELDQEVALYAVGPSVSELIEKYEDFPEVVAYLGEVRDDIAENLSQFREEAEAHPTSPIPVPGAEELPFRKYEVNVVVDNSELEGAPVVMEINPTYNNLFGRIEKEAQFGALITDFTMIREGSLHRANGGYLVLPVEEVLRNLFSWDSLKRALRNKEIAVEEAGERLGFVTTKSLRPEPIPLDAKVVLIGQPTPYYLLYTWDEDFSELFKVKADFDTRLARTDENIRDYAAFVCTLCGEEGLKHLDASALAKLIEHSSRLAEDQEKLSARFGEISDIIREASFYATQDDAAALTAYVTDAHVQKAIEEKFYRSNLVQERINEAIERGTIMIDAVGEEVGQVNGLSVSSLGDISFGRPSRITASVGLGREGLMDIEREAKLGGPIHTKGVMILSGYLADEYAQDKPLSLSAHLVFEQSYSEIEGDSASSTELYALLSSLSDLPIKQGIAVTGSINQKGEVQAIGGVNEKIEGFFETCQAKGLTGEQGVLIPASNVQHLMLKEEVVEAVREGKFHVWSVETVDEGIEILTGVKAGVRKEDGTFEEDSVNGRVDKRLRELAESMRDFAKEGKSEDGGGEEEEAQSPVSSSMSEAAYTEFPLSTVIYNLVTLGGALVVGGVIMAQFGLWATIGYLLLLALTGDGLLTLVCARCGYYGHRCALGLGKVAALVFKKRDEEEFFCTGPQFIVSLLLVLALLLPIAGGIALLVEGFGTGRLLLLVTQVGLLLAGLVPHPRLVCSHCRQGERGVCPVGRRLWKDQSTVD